MRKLVALIVVALAATAGTAGGHSQEVKKQCADAVAPILCAIDFYRDGTWAYQAKTGTALTKTVYADRRTESQEFREWIRDLWHDRYHAARKAYEAAPYLSWWQWDVLALCESRGNWGAQGPTYQGGLGIHYGVWDEFGGGQFAANAGDATREQQIIVAYRIYQRYGWSPWGCATNTLGWA